MIGVDSSAWVEYDRGSGSLLDVRLTGLIRNHAAIACTDPVMMEILARTRNEESATALRRLLTSFAWIPALAPADFEAAARIYRACRQVGVQPGGMIDCLIGATALRTDSSLLTADGGFTAMTGVIPLRLETIDD